MLYECNQSLFRAAGIVVFLCGGLFMSGSVFFWFVQVAVSLKVSPDGCYMLQSLVNILGGNRYL